MRTTCSDASSTRSLYHDHKNSSTVNTNDERRQRRADNVKAAELLLSEGKVNEAVDKFKRATSITSEHFRSLNNVDVIVSPYESDAQLAFLVNEGFADVVVTEDSDLIAFGCEKIIFKWNCENGDCTIYEKKELPRCFSGVMSSQFDFTKFRRICILSGCDYLQAGLPGIGLNKALSFFSKTSRTDLKTVGKVEAWTQQLQSHPNFPALTSYPQLSQYVQTNRFKGVYSRIHTGGKYFYLSGDLTTIHYYLLPRIPSYLNMSKLTVSKEFIQEFIRAENTFIYQVVFDPRQRCQRPLTPYPFPEKGEQTDEVDDDVNNLLFRFFSFANPNEKEDYSYAGEVLSSKLAVRLALGNQVSPCLPLVYRQAW
ncbi:unnamed protein product [Strongylus vulgaris]|uniref:Exonuclease 1 n=1 Tax=Strongylus vulgaris TaxID=40348 RepID=A0A3P7L4B9_STRVU|nr:unnamed protein product [Strongylus vulgaris]